VIKITATPEFTLSSSNFFQRDNQQKVEASWLSVAMAIEQALVPASKQQVQLLPTPSDPMLSSLNELLHTRAEIFASPSTSYATGGGKDIYQATLQATKYLFDNCGSF